MENPARALLCIESDAAEGSSCRRARYAHLQGRGAILTEMRIVDDEGRELPWDGKAFGNLQVRCALCMLRCARCGVYAALGAEPAGRSSSPGGPCCAGVVCIHCSPWQQPSALLLGGCLAAATSFQCCSEAGLAASAQHLTVCNV